MIERLGDDARRLLVAAGLPEGDRLAAITESWPAAVGDAISRNAWPQRLGRDDTLHVATVSATWSYELDRLATSVLDRLRAVLGEAAPAGLRFAPGPVPEPAGVPEPPESVDVPAPSSLERREAVTFAAQIDDSELRALVERAAAASLARARSGRRF